LNAKIKLLFLLIGLIILCESCSNLSPAGFWTSFHQELIIKHESDQGPWGGKRIIHWKTKSTKPFNEKELLNYATKNDWKLLESHSFETSTENNTNFKRLKSNEYSLDKLLKEVLTKEIIQGWKLYVFKTTWMLVDQKDIGETFENGFILLNSSKTELKIIHFWGE
jgi:hypothetical protein